MKALNRSIWLEIDLDAIQENFLSMKKMAGDGVKIMPAVKANAYGHGIVESCRVLEKCGADYFGVGSLDEVITLRENGISTPLLVFASNTVSEVADVYVKYGAIPTILTLEEAESISRAAAGKMYSVFLKIETERGRLGVNAEEFAAFAAQVAALPNLKIEGMYSHMSCADWADKEQGYSMWQYERFQGAVRDLKRMGISIPFMQMANTIGSIAYPGIRMTGIYLGSAIWGFSSLEKREGHPRLRSALKAWKSRLVQVKEVISGKFGPNFEEVKFEKPLRIGVMVGGLRDGLDAKQCRGYVLVRGKRVPVASRLCVEHSILNLSACPEASVGDEVVIMGRQGDEEISRDEVTKLWGESMLQFMMATNMQRSRIYFQDGKICSYAHGDTVKKL